ncbi:sushi domain-containing protein 6-like [Lissotriton helveticus]
MLGDGRERLGPYLWPRSVPAALLLVTLCDCASVIPKSSVCSRPPVLKHGGFKCSYKCSPLCDGMHFVSGCEVNYYCDTGFTLSAPVTSARCRQGKWSPTDIMCHPSPGYKDSIPPSQIPGPSISLVAAVAATVAGLLLMGLVCVLVKPKSHSCQCGRDYNRMEEAELHTEHWCPVPLPSYEEAVYGSQGRPLSPTSFHAPLPLILAEEDLVQQDIFTGHMPIGASQHTGGCTPPPSYEEVQAAVRGTSSGGDSGTFLNSPLPFLLGVPADK